MATIWMVVFHFASRLTGTPTRASARNSRSPRNQDLAAQDDHRRQKGGTGDAIDADQN